MPNSQQPAAVGLVAPLIIEAAAASGTAPRFSMLAYTGEPLVVCGYNLPIVVDLFGLDLPAQRVPIRKDHDVAEGVGHTETISANAAEGRLTAAGFISRATPAAQDVIESARRGFPWQCSITAQPTIAPELIPPGQTGEANGRTYTGPVYIARRSRLKEISFCDEGADGNTAATIAARKQPNPMEQNMPEPTQTPNPATPNATPATPAPVQAAAQPAPTPAPAQPAPVIEAAADPSAQMRARAAAEAERIGQIQTIAADHPAIQAQAIREGWAPMQTENAVLKASRPTAPAAHIPDNTITAPLIEAALCQTCGLPNIEASFDAKTLDAAHRRYPHGLGLQEVLIEAAAARGAHVANRHDFGAVLQAAFAVVAATAASTVNVGGILSNTANKFLLQAYRGFDSLWRTIAGRKSVRDFKANDFYRLTGIGELKPVKAGGDLESGKLGEEKYSGAADTFGLLLSIDRRDWINDDLAAFSTVPQHLGAASAKKLASLFWSTFMDNAAFFLAANSNYIEGSTTVLGSTGLGSAVEKFRNQTDADGQPIGVSPKFLVVPPALEQTAKALYASSEIRDGSQGAKYALANTFQSQYQPVVSPYLQNTKITGNSSTAFYLVADPMEASVVDVLFLNGNESPTIEQAAANFQTLGIQMRCYFDFGVTLADHRAGVKSKGAA